MAPWVQITIQEDVWRHSVGQNRPQQVTDKADSSLGLPLKLSLMRVCLAEEAVHDGPSQADGLQQQESS